ncbi:DAAF6-like protein [Mya arenaria]|uniref:DAAF6-like protein n=1 Tax=Mya arenaria TaxID=6604 RepID=A0ABY7DNI4_MYAAR|nr:dynein axonemal assembly factor 6-like [Mya arenaria]WAQ98438.1 DAAF6-like protein [Mya arenaria]
MDGGLAPGMLSDLCDMLKPADEDSDSDEEKPQSSIAQLNPGNIGPEKKAGTTEKEEKVKKNTKDIWDAEEVQEGAEFESMYDPRPQPDYDIVYKQAVTSEDMFLQMGNKTPATSSCEDMVVKVKLPDTKIADVALDVKTKFLDCRTRKYFLGLHLPHPVDSKSGKAQWDGKTETLSVTLRLKRDYDFMNF